MGRYISPGYLGQATPYKKIRNYQRHKVKLVQQWKAIIFIKHIYLNITNSKS